MTSASTQVTDTTAAPPRPLAAYKMPRLLGTIQNAASVQAADPRYEEARHVYQDAMDELQLRYQSASDQERADAAPGKLASAVVGFGHGASLGIAGDPEYIAMARDAHPGFAMGGDVLGAAATTAVLGANPLFAGLTKAQAGLMAGTATGATRGAVTPEFSGNRAIDATIGGVASLVGGWAVGKALDKAAPVFGTILNNFRNLFGKSPRVATSALKDALIKAGVAPEDVDRIVMAEAARSIEAATPPPPVTPPKTAGSTPLGGRPGSAPPMDAATQAQLEVPTFMRRPPSDGIAEQLTRMGVKPEDIAKATVIPDAKGAAWQGFSGTLNQQIQQVANAPTHVLELATNNWRIVRQKPFPPQLFRRMVNELASRTKK